MRSVPLSDQNFKDSADGFYTSHGNFPKLYRNVFAPLQPYTHRISTPQHRHITLLSACKYGTEMVDKFTTLPEDINPCSLSLQIDCMVFVA